MRRTTIQLLSALFILSATSGLARAGTALASNVPAAAPPAIAHRAAENISAQKVYAFAEAAGQVVKITRVWKPRIDGAASAEEATRYKTQAVQQMQRAILGSGLTMDEYQSIGRAAQNDPMLRQEIQELVQEMQ